jgi:hypothetical protein
VKTGHEALTSPENPRLKLGIARISEHCGVTQQTVWDRCEIDITTDVACTLEACGATTPLTRSASAGLSVCVVLFVVLFLYSVV